MMHYAPDAVDISYRANSGVYLQGRYEIQIPDSFVTPMGRHNCGVLYAQVTPDINMCYPALTWQTFDMDFTAARFGADRRKTANARVTVRLNGVKILDTSRSRAQRRAALVRGPRPAPSPGPSPFRPTAPGRSS